VVPWCHPGWIVPAGRADRRCARGRQPGGAIPGVRGRTTGRPGPLGVLGTARAAVERGSALGDGAVVFIDLGGNVGD